MRTTTDDFYEELGAEFQFRQILMLKKALEEVGVSEEQAKKVCRSFTFRLAMLFDQGTVEVEGKPFRPKLCFSSDDEVLYLQSDMFEFHEYAHGNVDEAFGDAS